MSEYNITRLARLINLPSPVSDLDAGANFLRWVQGRVTNQVYGRVVDPCEISSMATDVADGAVPQDRNTMYAAFASLGAWRRLDLLPQYRPDATCEQPMLDQMVFAVLYYLAEDLATKLITEAVGVLSGAS